MAKLTRRVVLALAAAPGFAQSVATVLPDLGPRLEGMWRRALAGPEATIVSSILRAKLPPLRGWRDERFLTAYIAWSQRPETLAVRVGGVSGRIEAELGPYDEILIRRAFEDVVTATPTIGDPVGYALLRPGAGRQQIELRGPVGTMHTVRPLPIYGLSTKPLPTIEAVVAVSGNVVTLYGTGFEGGEFVVESEAGVGRVLFRSAGQVNAEVPSMDRVRLTIDDSPSLWVAVQR